MKLADTTEYWTVSFLLVVLLQQLRFMCLFTFRLTGPAARLFTLQHHSFSLPCLTWIYFCHLPRIRIFRFYTLTNQSLLSSQRYGWLVRGEQGQWQHPAMEEEEPAALQPSVWGSEGSGDEGNGAPQPGQPLPCQHWDPSSPLPPTPPPQSPPLWHAEGRLEPGALAGIKEQMGAATHFFLFHSFYSPSSTFSLSLSITHYIYGACLVSLPMARLIGFRWLIQGADVFVFECFNSKSLKFTDDSPS